MMKEVCTIPLYGTEGHYTKLKLLLLRRVIDSIEQNSKDMTEEGFMSSLASALQGQVEINVEYDSEHKDAYDASFNLMLTDIIEMLDTLRNKNAYKSILSALSRDKIIDSYKILLTRFNILEGKLDSHSSIFDLDSEAVFSTEVDESVPYKVAKSKIFKTTEGAARFAYILFTLDILSDAFINFEKGLLTTTETQLNSLIEEHKLKLFSTICKYLGEDESDLWNTLGIAKRSLYFTVMNKMKKAISNMYDTNSEALYEGYYDTLNGTKNDYFDAVIAYYQLAYFDDLVQEALGHIISYNKGFKGTLLSKGIKKYYYANDGGHKVKNWNENGDEKSAEDNTSKFSKLVLSCIPLGTSHINVKNNVGITKFAHTVSKLFSSISKLNGTLTLEAPETATPINKLVTYMSLFHDNPTYYASKIFELICGEEGFKREVGKSNIRLILKNDLEFTDTEIAVLDAIYKYIFAFNESDYNTKRNFSDYSKRSARSLEAYNTKINRDLGRYSIVQDIAGIMDDVMDLTYREIGLYDGLETIYERDKYAYRDLSENKVNEINYNIGYAASGLLESIKASIDTNVTSSRNVKVDLENGISFICQPLDPDSKTLTKNIFNASSAVYSGTVDGTPVMEVLILTLTDLTDKATRKNILEINTESTKHQIATHNILNFIDLILGTDFLSEDGLLKLSIMQSQLSAENFNRAIREFLLYATRGLFYLDLKQKHIADKDTRDMSFAEYVMSLFNEAALAFRDNRKKYLLDRDTGGYPKVAFNGITSTWLDYYLEAESVLNAEDITSVSKNVEGNNDANTSTSFLGGNIKYYLAKYLLRSANIKNTLAAIKADLEMQKLYLSIPADKKDARIKELELKTRRTINENTELDRLKTYTVPLELLSEELTKIDSRLISLLYKLSDLATDSLFFTKNSRFIKKVVVDSGARLGDATKLCKNMNELELLYHNIVHQFFGGLVWPHGKKRQDGRPPKEIIIQPTTYSDKTKFVQYIIDLNKKYKDKYLLNLSPDEIVDIFNETIGQSYRTTYKNTINLFKRILVGEIVGGIQIDYNSFNTADELNALLQRKIVIDGVELNFSESILTKLAQSKGEVIIKDTHYRKDAKGIIFNELLQRNAEYLYGDSAKIRQQLKAEELIFAKNLEDYGCSFYVSDVVGVPKTLAEIKLSDNIMAKAISHFYEGTDLLTYYQNWVKDGKLIISKEIDGEFTLNPLLLKYFYLESLMANNLRLSLTGSEIAHPNKYNIGGIKGLAKEFADINDWDTLDTEKSLRAYKHALSPSLELTPIIVTNTNIDLDNIIKEFGNKFIFATPYTLSLGITALEYYDNLKAEALRQGKTLVINDPTLIDIARLDRALGNENVLTEFIVNEGEPYELLDFLYLGDSLVETKKGFSVSLKDLGKWILRPNLEKLANSILTKIENVALGTQLKRNVIIPGTLHYMHLGNLKGISAKTKVAVIGDIKAPVWTFLSPDKDIDAHDGAALQNPIWTILENYSLGSQSVGEDMKPIWHHMDESTNSATLLKFAVFNISNLRMIDSLLSPVELHKIMKKMTHIRWSENGKWKTKVDGKPIEIDLTKVSEVGKANVTRLRKMGISGNTKVHFENIIIHNNPIYYKDNDGSIKEIVGFGKDESGNYFTLERKITNIRSTIYPGPTYIKTHIFNDAGELDPNGNHTIDSIYELWRAFGGFNSVSLNADGKFETSERSNLVVADFINNTTFKKANGSIYDPTTQSYELPLKEMMIGYVANESAVKNGLGNVNSRNAWYDDEPLTYMEIDNAGLGILMDADHSVIDATMTEFSLVITALEAGGRKHNLTKFIYRTLGSIAEKNVNLELQAVAKFLDSDDPMRALNEIYDIIGRVIIKATVEKDARPDLATKIIEVIEKDFNKHLDDHTKDHIKIPFSDPNIYSKILTSFIGSVNRKSIKRQYPGSGCVMVPGYNMMQIYKIPIKKDNKVTIYSYKFGDLWDLIVSNDTLKELYVDKEIKDSVKLLKTAVQKYLMDILKDLSKCPLIVDVEEFIPSDVIDICDSKGNSLVNYSDNSLVKGLNLDTFDKYYSFINDPKAYAHALGIEGDDIYFRQNVYLPRDLAPARISWLYTDLDGAVKTTNIFASWFYLKQFDGNKFKGAVDKDIVQALLDAIDKGYFYASEEDYLNNKPTRIIPGSLKNEAAEIIISDIYKLTFGTLETSLATIDRNGANAFRLIPIENTSSNIYDMILRSSSGNDVFVTFDKVSDSNTANSEFIPYKNSELKLVIDEHGTREIYTIDDDGRLLMKVGRDVLKEGWTYDKATKKYKDATGKEVGNTKGLSYVKGSNGQYLVFQRVYFISKYEVNVPLAVGNDTLVKRTLVYKINTNLIKRVIPKKEDEPHRRRLLAKTLNLLLKLDTFVGIELSTNLSKLTAIDISHIFGTHLNSRTLNLDLTFTPVITTLQLVLNEGIASKEDLIEFSNESIRNIKKSLLVYYNSLANARYTSWQKSRFFTVARIPALDHQSFMLMKAVAFTGSEKNVCHVSHFLTFLQGSDYDIDKAYVMACEIGNDGKYVKYSDLFDYSNIDTLNASLELPIPERFKITANAIKKSYDAATNTFRLELGDKYRFAEYSGDNIFYLDEYIKELDLLNTPVLDDVENSEYNSTQNKINRLRIVAKILKDTYDFLDKSDDPSGIIYAIKDEKYSDIFTNLVNMINIHNTTDLGTTILDKALKNFVSSSIQLVIQSPRNMISAYTPIEMTDIRKTSEDKGAAILSMNLYNPATKWLMQVLNMTGKAVIGITAVGEKVFFNASYYWNELLRRNNLDDIKHLRFALTFNRILGRSRGNLKTITCKKLANVNFEGCEHWISDFYTTADAIRDSLLYKPEYKELLDYIESRDYTEADLDKLTPLDGDIYNTYQKLKKELESDYNLKNLMNIGISAGLLISLLLSAATDNAKELILAKINADSNFAKCYLHLIMMGFSIKDITEFMTCPAVNLVVDLLKFNMFDPYVNKLNLHLAINLAKGRIISELFVHGTFEVTDIDEFGNEYRTGKFRPKTEQVNATLTGNSEFLNFIKDNLGEDHTFSAKLNDTLLDYITVCLKTDTNLDLRAILPNNDIEVSRLIDYVESLLSKLRNAIANSGSYENYVKDIEEFTRVELLASETSNLGSMLGLNLGLPSSKVDLLAFMAKVRGVVNSREKEFIGFKTHYSFGLYIQNSDTGEIKLDKKGEKIENKTAKEDLTAIIDKIVANNVLGDSDSYVDIEEITDIVKQAIYFGVLGKFDFHKWIRNDELKVGEPKYIAGEMYAPKKNVKYLDFIKDYYNIIKGTFSIFHILDNIPQFKSIYSKLLKMEYVIDDELALRSRLLNMVLKRLLDKTGYLDLTLIKRLGNYVNSLLVTDYLEHSSYKIPTKNPCYTFKNGHLLWNSTEVDLDLTTVDGRASFKYLMETEIVPKLKVNGWGVDVKDNYFILNLSVGFEKSGMSYLKVNLNLNNPNATPASTIKYLKTIDGLIALSKIKVTDKLSLADLFILYNLITNLNLFGKDRLTALFRPFVAHVKDNVFVDYYTYLGLLDKLNLRENMSTTDLDKERLDEIGYSDVDAQIAIASYFNTRNLYNAKGDFIITENENHLRVPHYRFFGKWEEYPAYPGLLKGETLDNLTLNRIRQYYTMLLPTKLTLIAMYKNLKTDISGALQKSDLEDLSSAINLLIKNGIIKYYKICHE